MNDLHTVAVTTSHGVTHMWENVMWHVSSDDSLVLYGLEDAEISPKSYKVAQFAKGAWDLVEIVQDEDEWEFVEEDEIEESEVVFYGQQVGKSSYDF